MSDSEGESRTTLPPWLTVAQVAAYYGVDYVETYSKLLPDLEFRRIGARGGAIPFGRLIRIERNSLLRLRGEPEAMPVQLPRWVTMKQAAAYYQVHPSLIRSLIAHEQLDARRIGSSKTIRVDRDSLLQPGHYPAWSP